MNRAARAAAVLLAALCLGLALDGCSQRGPTEPGTTPAAQESPAPGPAAPGTSPGLASDAAKASGGASESAQTPSVRADAPASIVGANSGGAAPSTAAPSTADVAVTPQADPGLDELLRRLKAEAGLRCTAHASYPKGTRVGSFSLRGDMAAGPCTLEGTASDAIGFNYYAAPEDLSRSLAAAASAGMDAYTVRGRNWVVLTNRDVDEEGTLAAKLQGLVGGSLSSATPSGT